MQRTGHADPMKRDSTHDFPGVCTYGWRAVTAAAGAVRAALSVQRSGDHDDEEQTRFVQTDAQAGTPLLRLWGNSRVWVRYGVLSRVPVHYVHGSQHLARNTVAVNR